MCFLSLAEKIPRGVLNHQDPSTTPMVDSQEHCTTSQVCCPILKIHFIVLCIGEYSFFYQHYCWLFAQQNHCAQFYIKNEWKDVKKRKNSTNVLDVFCKMIVIACLENRDKFSQIQMFLKNCHHYFSTMYYRLQLKNSKDLLNE